MTTTTELEFTGDLDPESFAGFAAHRAARLSVCHSVVSGSATSAVIRLTGPEALIDAFEMALSLGPRDCLVRDVRRLDNREPT
jgi:hypothetical protein